MDKPEHTLEIYLAILRAEIELRDKKEASKRRADSGILASDNYGAIEDVVLLRAIDDLLKRIWHKDDPEGHYRKGRMHLDALAFHLRKKLQEYL